MRLLMEQGVFHPEKSVSGWRHAWKEVFRGTQGPDVSPPIRKEDRIRSMREIRELRGWVHEVQEMAGRGMCFVLSIIHLT